MCHLSLGCERLLLSTASVFFLLLDVTFHSLLSICFSMFCHSPKLVKLSRFHDHRFCRRYSSMCSIFRIWTIMTLHNILSFLLDVIFLSFTIDAFFFFFFLVIHSPNLGKLGYLQVSGLPVLTHIIFYVSSFF